MVRQALARGGYTVFPPEPAVARWAKAARRAGLDVLARGGERRHGQTWFVGVDALPNASDGSVDGVPLAGTWLEHVETPQEWHQAQLSVVFPGYPRQDAGESVAAHRFRRNRDAAHVDGVVPMGPERQRYLREPHGFIAGLALDDIRASPLVVWQGSHKVMRAAFQRAFAGTAPEAWADLNVTDIYQTARRRVFDHCARTELAIAPGQVVLLDRHLLHGVAPWAEDATGEMRMMAYFRPHVDMARWL